MRFKIFISIIIIRVERSILNPMLQKSLSCDYASQKIDSRQRKHRGSRKVSGEVWVKRESPSSTADKWKRWATRRLTYGPSTPLFRAYLLSLCVDSGTNGHEIVLEYASTPCRSRHEFEIIQPFRYGLQIRTRDVKKKWKKKCYPFKFASGVNAGSICSKNFHFIYLQSRCFFLGPIISSVVALQTDLARPWPAMLCLAASSLSLIVCPAILSRCHTQ